MSSESKPHPAPLPGPALTDINEAAPTSDVSPIDDGSWTGGTETPSMPVSPI